MARGVTLLSYANERYVNEDVKDQSATLTTSKGDVLRYATSWGYFPQPHDLIWNSIFHTNLSLGALKFEFFFQVLTQAYQLGILIVEELAV